VIVRHASRWSRLYFRLFLLGLAIPLQAVIIPVYLLIIRMHLYDSLLAIILPSAAFAIPVTVMILVTFLRDVPRSLFEAMVVDGASEAPVNGDCFSRWLGRWHVRPWSRSRSMTGCRCGTGSCSR
jgi:ABC-type glycerol-3-phosphate transport system permease component